jgi:hypothetical protein
LFSFFLSLALRFGTGMHDGAGLSGTPDVTCDLRFLHMNAKARNLGFELLCNAIKLLLDF